MRMVVYQMSPLPCCIFENATPWEAFEIYAEVLAKLKNEEKNSFTAIDFDWFVESLVCKHEVALYDLDDRELLHIFVGVDNVSE